MLTVQAFAMIAPFYVPLLMKLSAKAEPFVFPYLFPLSHASPAAFGGWFFFEKNMRRSIVRT